MESNQEKGYKYECYINDLLNKDNCYCWLWDFIPEFELRNAGILGNWNEHRFNRKTIKINGLNDTGTDLLYKDEYNQYKLIQCKNYDSKNYITIHDLAGFYMMVSTYDLPGIVYYTSKLSHNITIQKNTSKIQYIQKSIKKDKKNTIYEYDLLNHLYDYQLQAYHNIMNEFNHNNRAVLQMPCGMGV